MNAQNILLVFLIFLLLSLGFFFGMLKLLLSRRKRILSRGPEVKAVVTHFDQYSTKWGLLNRSWLSFKTFEGQELQVVHLTPRKGKKYPVGQALTLKYDPINPRHYLISGDEGGYRVRIGVLIFGILVCTASFIGFLFVYRSFLP